MWYLNRGHRLDMNVQEAWKLGATGKGISVTILDDGIERSHPDLVANYDPLASFDVNQNNKVRLLVQSFEKQTCKVRPSTLDTLVKYRILIFFNIALVRS